MQKYLDLAFELATFGKRYYQNRLARLNPCIRKHLLHLKITSMQDTRLYPIWKKTTCGMYCMVFSPDLPIFSQHWMPLKTFYTSGIYANDYMVFAFPFVCSSIKLMELTSKFCVEVSLSGSISRTTRLKKLLFGPWVPWTVCFLPWVQTPGVGLEVKTRTPYCSTTCTFSFMLTPKYIMLEISHPYDMGFCVLRWRSMWPVFHAWVILPLEDQM